ncbi:DotU family type IV/VI secretion system protein, partial [Salmonella enterica subsp. enterica serovar Typhimurium]|uniref:DotU family type IV/VI secretion system protein n=1 Tax=Salmonella enterica TaxID=28901 RepID=UPI0026158C38
HLYQTLCDQANLRREHVLAVRYCLCTALDEAANPYRNLLVREMHLYQTLCDQANLRREHVLAVRYCLCTALDEAAN